MNLEAVLMLEAPPESTSPPNSDLAALLAAGITTEHSRFSPDQITTIQDWMATEGKPYPRPAIVADWDAHGMPSPVMRWGNEKRSLTMRFTPDGSVLYVAYSGQQAIYQGEVWSSFDLDRLMKWVNRPE